VLSHGVLAKIYANTLLGRIHQISDLAQLFDLDRFPGQGHLQVTPEARNKCVGLVLMLKFHEYLKAHGVPGQHGVVLEEAGREAFSTMLQALHYRIIHERIFTSRDHRSLIHPGIWKERVLIRES
ncbi:MAG TPA: hypothetical protein VFY80_02255, partial [Burkholderiales bacterium]|nr:hypothetical protein [Burkholderiales bacterium]